MNQFKKISCVIIFLVFSQAFAQKKDTVFSNANLTKATVYFGFGADLHHSCKANLTSGIQELVINNISLNPDINTIQIACPENVTILSYTHRIFYRNNSVKPTPLNLKSYDTLKQLQKKVLDFNNEININTELLDKISKLIENNFTTPDKKNINSDELIKLTSYYADKVNGLRQKNYTLKNDIILCNEKINEINERLSNAETETNNQEDKKPIGQLLLQIISKETATTDFEINYFTRNAGWIPTYDVRVKTIDNSFKLVYKAMVSQTTGLNWNNVKLNLSTSNPNQSNAVPILSPLYLQLYVPVLYTRMYGGVEALAISNAPAMKENEVDFKDTKKPMVADDANSDVSENLTLHESQLNTNYEIDLPYDIPSDGIPYSVNIKEEKINVSYQHFSIPKLDKDAFLLMKINRWDTLNLLPGQANIIMDNVYTGKSYINPNTTNDTLEFSLGRDKRIAIDRTLKKEYVAIKKSDNKVEQYTYEIVVKNNKKQPIDLVLKDQFPVSKTKEIEVALKDSDNAEIDQETGQLTWNVKLQSGESKKYRFSYQIKYPKDKVIQESR